MANVVDVQTKWELMLDEAYAELEARHFASPSDWRMLLSISGDPSFTMDVARAVAQKVLDGDTLSARDRLWLFGVLRRISKNSVTAAAVRPGKGSGRGAPKKGSRALTIALRVLREVLGGDVKSIEEAQGLIAEQEHVEEVTVRKYWARWKPVFASAWERRGRVLDVEMKKAFKLRSKR